ncbi:MAG: hypothetical protein WCK49_08410 [Myxococcaceae bacterium]
MKLLLIILALGLSACRKQKLVRPIHSLSPEWMPVQIKNAEQAWIIPGEGSSLLIDSECSPNSQNVPLIGLTGQLLIGMTDQTLIEQKTIPFQNREALVSTYALKVDGAFQKMHILVLKKDGCVFDVVLSTPTSVYEKRLPDFKQVERLFTLEHSKK